MLPVPRRVLVLHDDGRWYGGTLLDAYRDGDGWRAVVRYTHGAGLAVPAGVSYDELRPVAAAN